MLALFFFFFPTSCITVARALIELLFWSEFALYFAVPQLFHPSSGGSTKVGLEVTWMLLEDFFFGLTVVFLDVKFFFSKRQYLWHAPGPQLFMLFGFGAWGVSQAFTRISPSDPGSDCDIFSGKPSSFFLANMDIFQSWHGLLSFPNVLKVSVLIPKEKP